MLQATSVHYDSSQPLVLACDASLYNLSTIQVVDRLEYPVCFVSSSLIAAKRNYSHFDKEAMHIWFGVIKFNKYIYFHHFTI